MIYKKNDTIRKQLIRRCIFLVVIILSMHWLLNVILLQYIYMRDKTNKLTSMYNYLNSVEYYKFIDSNDEQNIDAFRSFKMSLGALCRRDNISFVIINDNSEMVLASMYEPEQLRQYWEGILIDFDDNVDKAIVEGKNYSICTLYDPIENVDYLAMSGKFDNGDRFLLRTSLESIRESAFVSSKLAFYIGMGVILVSLLFIIYISSKVTKPIGELTELSKRMANLDFDSKYTGAWENEIDVLGNNFNKMSESLQTTIDELRTANDELRIDVENKAKIDLLRKEFVANISHELKTPLALISGYAEGLREGITDDPESMKYYCDVIVDEAEKMGNLVKKLISLGQYEGGSLDLELTRFNIADFVSNYILASEIFIKEKNVNVIVDDRAQDTDILSDEFRVEEVFRNYFTNALNHVDGKGVIKITIENIDEKIYIRVFNSGKPIPEESIAFIWDKFYKVDKARTREYGGSGIGLSIVKAIMENLNGECGVENKEDGVEFWFALDHN